MPPLVARLIPTFRFSDLAGISMIRIAQNGGKQNKKSSLRFGKLPTMDITGIKHTENILISSYRHQHNSYV